VVVRSRTAASTPSLLWKCQQPPWVEQTFTVNAQEDQLYVSHSGDLPLATFPTDIPRLTDPALADSLVSSGKLRDSTGQIVGIATQVEDVLPDTDLAAGRLHSKSVWTLFLPARGAITVEQVKRNDKATGTVFKQALKTGTPWVGDLTARMTDDHSGAIVGGSQEFAGIKGSAVEVDQFRRFDPQSGELTVRTELRLRYRISTAASTPARGPLDGAETLRPDPGRGHRHHSQR
jgi:hypothetical protein